MLEILGLALSVACVVVWIVMLIDAARTARWAWFVLTLVFWPVAFGYWAIEYRSPRTRQEVDRRPRRRARRRPAGLRTRLGRDRRLAHKP